MAKNLPVIYKVPDEKLKFIREAEKMMIGNEIIEWMVEKSEQFNSIPKLPRRRVCRDYTDIFQRWHKVHHDLQEMWEFEGIRPDGRLLKKTIAKIKKDSPTMIPMLEFYRKNDLSKIFGGRWNIRFMPDFWHSLIENQLDMLNFIKCVVTTLLPGYFKILDRHDCRFGNTYISISLGKYQICAGIFLERVPVYLNEDSDISHYEYRQVLKLFKLTTTDIWTLYDRYLYKYRMKIKTDPHKGVPFQDANARKNYITSDLEYEERYYFTLNSGRGAKIYTRNKSDIRLIDENIPIYCPIDVRIADMAAHDQRVQVSDDAKFIMDLEVNQEMVLSFFEKLEEIGIKFSEQQRQMLTSSENAMVLGRSGTGKTTISAFKIIALDMLFMAYKKRFVHNKKSFTLTYKDFRDMSGCFTVFCTASPVLTNEVKRFYADLIDKIKKFIKAREAKRRLKKLGKEEQEKKEIEQNAEVIESKDIKEDTKNQDEEGEGEDEGEGDNSFNAFDDEPEETTEQAEQVQFKDDIVNSLNMQKEQLLEDLELEKQLTLYSTLRSIPKTEFPLFLTVKKLVYMLDGDCTYSFFCRDNNGHIYGMDSSSEWHTESKEGALMINQYQKEIIDFESKIKQVGTEIIKNEEMEDEDKIRALQAQGIDMDQEQWDTIKELGDEEDDDDDFDENQHIQNLQNLLRGNVEHTGGSKMKLQEQMFSSEVTFEMFEKHFWHRNKGGLKLSAINVWTEIYSVIKGSISSFSYWQSYYNESIMSWKRYKKMKSSMNYIDSKEKHRIYLIYLRYEDWKRQSNYYDFMDVVRHVLTFYPFYKRASLDYLVVDEVQDLTPLTIQLLLGITKKNAFLCGDTAQTIAKGVGFRFHDLKSIFENRKMGLPQIIQLTRNYRSHNQILELANSIVDLIEYFFPETIDKLRREESKIDGPKPLILEGFDQDNLSLAFTANSSLSQPRFGCNQVVIVRNQESKHNLPLCLQHALCLTVYEAKGLEFEDVILYNFFTDSHVDDKMWRLFREMEVVEVEERVSDFGDIMSITELDFDQYKAMLKRIHEEEAKGNDPSRYETVKRIQANRSRDEINRNFGMLCVELKHLYVSITRPKNKLVIIDQNIKGRRGIYDYWIDMEVVDVCYKGEEKNHPILSEGFETTLDEEKSKEEWRSMGLKLFRKKLYKSVVMCFERSGDEELKTRTLGYMHADEATHCISEAETLEFAAQRNKTLNKREKSDKKKEAKENRRAAKEKFKLAGDYFKQIGLFEKAAQCFYSAEEYEEAAGLFEKAKQFQQAAESYKNIGNFAKAARMFEDSNLPLKAFECYEKDQDWEGLLECLNRQKDNFRRAERDSLINRYVPIALNSIYHLMSNDETGKKLEEKYAVNENDIKEEENEESDSDEPAEEKKEDEKPKVDDEEETIITTKENKVDDKPMVTKIKETESVDESFDIISKGEFDRNVEHLSNFDPDDEFLKSDHSFSVIGSVVAKDEETLSEYSDFSIVSGSRASQFVNSNVIQTEKDIYIQDIAMQKIIYYISFFSDDVKRSLTSKRSREGLLQLDQDATPINFLELELDNIDADLMKLILDVLEHFEMFRLCLIVCNRYGMQEHVSRYLTSICYKYSPKYIQETEILKINNAGFREKQRQVSILANEAIHSMLKLVDPRMIQQTKTEDIEESSRLLKPECWRYIFYLGFWKKLIYIMDTHSSLQLCYTMGDFENFKTVYLLNYRPELLDDEIRDLIKHPEKSWLDQEVTGLLKFLGNKVNLEISSQNYEVDLLDSSCQCNINANKYLKLRSEQKEDEARPFIVSALKHASNIFQKYRKYRQLGELKECKEDYDRNLELFDIFYFYGRVFSDKHIRGGIKAAISDLETRSLATSCIFSMCDFLINLIDNPSTYSAMLSQEEVDVILQALFIPQKVRIPDVFKLTIDTLSYVLMNTHSRLFKFLESIVTEFKGDKANRELISLYDRYKTEYETGMQYFGRKNQELLIKSSHQLRFTYLTQHIEKQKIVREYKQFKSTNAGRNHDYYNVICADLASEFTQSTTKERSVEQFLHVPIHLCMYWLKKYIYSFMSQTI